MSDWQSEVPHILVVTGEGEDTRYELEHLSECETYDHLNGSGIECGVGFVLDGEGEPWAYTRNHDIHLPAGRYEVRFDHHTYPATPNGPEEYDAWLEVERVDG